MKISETPEKWVIIKVKPNHSEAYYRVFATWAGTYLDGDRWRLNSGIKSIKEEGDYYLIEGLSGSWYKCHKDGWGFKTTYGKSILDEIISKANQSNELKVELIDKSEINSLLF